MRTTELAERAEQRLRTYQYLGHTTTELLRFLTLPAHGEYECWQLARRMNRRMGRYECFGVYGKWCAMQDAVNFFDPSTGLSMRDDIEPTIVWLSAELEPEFVNELLASFCATRVPIVCPMAHTMADGVRYEVRFAEPNGTMTAMSMLSWVSMAPMEWQSVEVNIRRAIDEIHRSILATGGVL